MGPALIFYYVMFAISLLLPVVYASIFHKHLEASLTIMVVLVPIINMAFVVMGNASMIEEAIAALRLTYMGGCFVLLCSMFLIFNICGVKLQNWMRMLLVALSIGVYSTTLTIGHSDIFYVGMPTLGHAYGASYIDNKTYGFMHTVFYVLIGVYYLATVTVVIYSFFKKKQVPRNILVLIVLSISVSVIGFFGGRLIFKDFELLPLTYNIGIVIYLIIATRLRLYDASDSVTDTLVEKGDTGFISFDYKMRLLGCNETAKKMIPELQTVQIDHQVENEWLKQHLLTWVDEFEKDEFDNKKYVERDEKTYLVTINRLVIGNLTRGYQFLLSDDTKNQEYIKLIKTYNSQLEAEVKKKTMHVVEMQEKLVLGMATMVEGRDNSTGGHIKRTSDCIRFLVDEIRKDNKFNLSEQFCNNLIKAAPMHDLGKIAVDDQILRKPGRFTPEEFEVMKTHAAEGARIVAKILEGTDDVEFNKIVVNVAHYHHERWDGSGYPEGLKGEEIPFEARIMAIVDVYDALVSKRVYKESMTFEQADQIILEGMGKHFDKALEPYYIKARPKFEEYYKSLD